jgi:hypothetical protein
MSKSPFELADPEFEAIATSLLDQKGISKDKVMKVLTELEAAKHRAYLTLAVLHMVKESTMVLESDDSDIRFYTDKSPRSRIYVSGLSQAYDVIRKADRIGRELTRALKAMLD